MPEKAAHAPASREYETAHSKTAQPEKTPLKVPSAAAPPVLRAASPSQTAAALTHLDKSLRAAALARLQKSHGNQHVQRVMRHMPAAGKQSDLAQRLQSATAGGAPLAPAAQQKVGAGLGTDLSDVRVHTDSEADALARSVQAIAFTTGQHIFFRQGAYQPDSPEGLRLITHEAAHTVQQASGPVNGTPIAEGVNVSDPQDSFEQSADRTANAVAAGHTSNIASAAQRQLPKEEASLQTKRDSVSIQRQTLSSAIDAPSRAADTVQPVQRQDEDEEEWPTDTAYSEPASTGDEEAYSNEEEEYPAAEEEETDDSGWDEEDEEETDEEEESEDSWWDDLWDDEEADEEEESEDEDTEDTDEEEEPAMVVSGQIAPVSTPLPDTVGCDAAPAQSQAAAPSPAPRQKRLRINARLTPDTSAHPAPVNTDLPAQDDAVNAALSFGSTIKSGAGVPGGLFGIAGGEVRVDNGIFTADSEAETVDVAARLFVNSSWGISGRGRKDVTGANSPLIDERTYLSVANDLKPAGIGRPPRLEYWVSSFTATHEMFHVMDVIGRMQEVLPLGEEWLNAQTINVPWDISVKLGISDDVQTQLTPLLTELTRMLNANVAAYMGSGESSPAEGRAYGAGEDSYWGLLSQIKERAVRENWPNNDLCPG